MEMPILNPQFFHDHAPSMEFFQTWKNLSSWSEQVLPIYEWQGILFIGVSGDKQPSISVPHVFVKVDAISLMALWGQWSEEQDDELAATAIPDLSAESVAADEEFEIEVEGEEAPKPEPQVQAVSSSPPQPPTQNMDIPEGLGGVETSSLASDIPEGLGGLDTSSTASDIPEGMAAIETKADTEVPDGISFDAPEVALGSISDSSDVLDLGGTTDPLVSLAPTKAEVIPAVVADFSEETPIPVDKKIPTPTSAKPSAASKVVAPTAASPKPAAQVSATVKSAADVDLSDIFEKLNAHFRESMVLLVQGQVAKPWKWTEGFKAPTKILNFDISQPSPFRVIFRTHKSYYGSVKSNPVIDQLTQNWLQGKAPTELTMASIMLNDRLVGIVLCNGNPDVETLKPLKFLENISQEISGRFSANPKILQAA